MMDMDFTLASKRASPMVQALASLLIGWVGMVLCKVFGAAPGTEYFAAMVAIIFYTIINTVVSIAHTSFMRYTVPSYYLYIGLLVVVLLSAKFVSGISIWLLEEYRMMLITITMFYAVVSLLVRVMRAIYEAAENDF
jgi:hypothetical protein